MNDEILIVAGPTASGKSALALALAAELRGTVINADSMQVYRDLPILTAQPDHAAKARIPHRLYGEIDAADGFSAGAWRERAVAEIAAARGAGRVPILVGGTGLYLRALLEGLAPTPPIPAEVKREARAMRAELGAAAFHERLRTVDPGAAAKLGRGDTLRVLRAYEVVTATGRTLGDWQREQVRTRAFSARTIVLLPPREPLYAACDGRFLAMMARGAAEEVKALAARSLDPGLPAMRALGVSNLIGWLVGQTSREVAVAAAQQATRNYAKRQITWFKHQLPEAEVLRKLVLETQFSERLLPEIFAFIRH
ncbi:MAG: tRNA (adenosine(37)-N6)-dimethylallyltransferase MiaA [Stellaceae bacterium]